MFVINLIYEVAAILYISILILYNLTNNSSMMLNKKKIKLPRSK